jgi:hypothetical protein
MACRTCPQSGWPPASTRVRPPDTRLDTVAADQFSCGHPGSGWPGDGHGGPLHRPVGRTPQFKVTASSMGLDPVRTATAKRRTPPAPSVRPCAWPSGRGLFSLALTGQDGHAHARLRPTQALPAAGPARHDHLHPCSMPERPQAGYPSDVRAVVSGVHDGRHDRTAFRTPHVRPDPAGHRPLHPATPAEPEATRTGERTNGTAGTRRHPGPPRPPGPPGPPACPLGRPIVGLWIAPAAIGNDDRSGTVRYLPARDHLRTARRPLGRSVGQAAPWRTALLGRLRVERRANGDASSVMARRWLGQ